jgi:glycosyltransferase involved in cell wall biosynthesis
MSSETHSHEPNASSGVMISVIIPTLNEEKMIGHCLEHIAQSDLLRGQFEVIIVDNGSRDRTIEISQTFAQALPLRILRREGVHISALRNFGASHALGRTLAFLDADCIAPRNWLAQGIHLINEGGGIIGAHYQIPSDSKWVGRIWYQDRTADKVGDVSYVPAGSLLIPRQLFFSVGGFDEAIQTNEDFDLCQRVIAAGKPVRSYSELKVIHLGTPQTLLGFYRKQLWHGTHVLAVFLRDPEKKKNRRPIALSFYAFACALGMGSGLLAGVTARSWTLLEISVVLLLAPLLGIASYRSARRQRWAEAIPLTLLYLAFAMARARALLNYKS